MHRDSLWTSRTQDGPAGCPGVVLDQQRLSDSGRVANSPEALSRKICSLPHRGMRVFARSEN